MVGAEIGEGCSRDGAASEWRNELEFRAGQKKAELIADISRRSARLAASAVDSADVVNSTRILDGTNVDFNISSESETASGSLAIKVRKNNNLVCYILIALGVLTVVAIFVFGGQ